MSLRAVLADYGGGNLRSVQSALARQGVDVVASSDPAVVRDAPLAIIAGVGHAASAMAGLAATGLADALRERDAGPAFEGLLRQASWLLTASFVISAVLNFFLAIWMLKAEPASEEWTRQLGRMNWVSWPVIVVPSMGMMVWALFRLMNGIQRLTGLKAEEMFHAPPPKPPKPAK